MQFDDAAAATAIAELSAARRILGETQSARSTATRTARAEFSGAYAESFTDASSGLDQEASAAVDGLNTLQRSIEDAVEEAARRRRDVAAAQATWDSEAAEERRIRQEHPNIPI